MRIRRRESGHARRNICHEEGRPCEAGRERKCAERAEAALKIANAEDEAFALKQEISVKMH